jgi:hypothetical protein
MAATIHNSRFDTHVISGQSQSAHNNAQAAEIISTRLHRIAQTSIFG